VNQELAKAREKHCGNLRWDSEILRVFLGELRPNM
jgi:hypothetical protein